MPNNKRYTQEELDFIKRNYNKMKVSEIADKLGRSEKAVRNKIERLGFKLEKLKRNEPFKWTKEREQVIKDNCQQNQTLR